MVSQIGDLSKFLFLCCTYSVAVVLGLAINAHAV